MPKDYALKKLHSKERIIICGCDAISGLLIHYLLDELFGSDEYTILHRFQQELEKKWHWAYDEDIEDDILVKQWFNTCWDWDRTIKAVKDADLKDTVRVYKFCDCVYINTELPF